MNVPVLPAAIVTVPDFATKSVPADAVPTAVAYCTDTDDAGAADTVTENRAVRDPTLPSSNDTDPIPTTVGVRAPTGDVPIAETPISATDTNEAIDFIRPV